MKPLRYAFLTPAHYPRLFRTFVEAFSDYGVDMSYLNENNLRDRWTKNNVSYESSVGAFDGDRMVGFMAVGLDDWKGRRAAFDAGTGIVREFRGFGAAPALFDLAIGGLREKGVETFVLEVIQTNKAAVRTYKKLKFRAVREFDCYQLDPGQARIEASKEPDDLIIEAVEKDLLPRFQAFADWAPSWENSFASLARIPDELRIYGARQGDRWIGFAAYYRGLGWITNIAVDPAFRRKGIGTRLLARLLRDLPAGTNIVKLVNADHGDSATAGLLDKMGFVIYARQFEMELEL